jgi:phosphonate transport system ATP-binding protein
MSAVRISSLSKSFQSDRKALDDVSLSIRTGEMVALIGASGSGKSTLLRHIAGLEVADRGNGRSLVDVFDREVQSQGRLHPRCRRIRPDVGVVFQQFNLVGRLSVLTNVLLGTLGRIPTWRGSMGLFSRHERQQAMEALDRVGIAEKALQRAATLSGGQQQRAAIARTLVQQACLVLADEPIASLDPSSATKVMEVLTRINREDGITIVVSLHQVDFARRYCPRVIAMRAGKVAYDGPSTALTPAFLKDIYGPAGEEILPVGEVAYPPAAAFSQAELICAH